MIYPAISCNLDTHILQSALPLFDAGEIEAIEWSFDTLYQREHIPEWFNELLRTFSTEGRLIGHGVFFSLFSGQWKPEQSKWLRHLKKVSSDFRFDHVTEHFGFMTGADFHKGAPLSIPCTARTLALGQDRLQRIYEACQCPVGLENLAFSYSLEEVKRQGDFLSKLVEPVNGFIILDLHNLYCQLHNFNIGYSDIIGLFPLEKVREIHISGGSWETGTVIPDRPIRRDTHDDAVPEMVFELLESTIPRCPNLKFVVLEQMGNALHTPQSQELFQSDFRRMAGVVAAAQVEGSTLATNPFLPTAPVVLTRPPAEDAGLHREQEALSHILENAHSYTHALELLQASPLAQTDWEPHRWAPEMLETAIAIAQKWKKGWD